MACACKGAKKTRYTVVLSSGIKITKYSEEEARTFAARHPGSRVVKG